MIGALEEWQHCLQGMSFELHLDHRNLPTGERDDDDEKTEEMGHCVRTAPHTGAIFAAGPGCKCEKWALQQKADTIVRLFIRGDHEDSLLPFYRRPTITVQGRAIGRAIRGRRHRPGTSLAERGTRSPAPRPSPSPESTADHRMKRAERTIAPTSRCRCQ